ncbi:hypothetical protein [Nostoc sp. MS1]|uniref:hypothetical protein n=1 Tax=Nostoc sp. MS1 TaxID=2764711 RepID=UPI001CC4F2E7|nr:hypothetical protein [Nostoc sp. MS1]BCL36556.1 hypothetical protein NSMS1_30030 [Nostoc sp. MS1]
MSIQMSTSALLTELSAQEQQLLSGGFGSSGGGSSSGGSSSGGYDDTGSTDEGDSSGGDVGFYTGNRRFLVTTRSIISIRRLPQ